MRSNSCRRAGGKGEVRAEPGRVGAVKGHGSPEGWYATCVAYFAAPAGIRKEVSPQTLATYRRIRRLPVAWGQELDRCGAPLFVMRWVAWGKVLAERERRYAEALAMWDTAGRWPRWDELTCRDGGERRRGRRRRVDDDRAAERPSSRAPASA